MKDSESEFGSLNSLKIGDEDSDSCIVQKPAAVPCSPGTAADSKYVLFNHASLVHLLILLRRSKREICLQWFLCDIDKPH